MSKRKQQPDSALKVNKGIEQPSSISSEAAEKFKNIRKTDLKPEDYIEGILKGDRTILSKAITLVESSLAEHHKLAQEIIEKCLPHSGKSIRVGITGVPGAGKSTFIEVLGKHLTSSGKKVAVLAIDPSSQRSKGSILGDKTRMEDLANDPDAYIRPSASAGSLGGVARKTRESIILCEAAGFDTIFVETIGVGQSETAVHSMVDFFLLLMIAGAGDELQGIKRGIMEMADEIIINKADGDNIEKANIARQQYANAVHLFSPSLSGWTVKVNTCSSLSSTGIKEIWDDILEYCAEVKQNGYFSERRTQQSLHSLESTLDQSLKDLFYNDPEITKMVEEYKKEILESRLSPYLAAQKLMEFFQKTKNE